MIKPITLDVETETFNLTQSHDDCLYGYESDGDYLVECYSLASGACKGQPVAYIRYIPSTIYETATTTNSIGPKYQVLGTMRNHKVSCTTYEEALHHVMALAYQYVADTLRK